MQNAKWVHLESGIQGSLTGLTLVSQVSYTNDGLEALVFTADGDMRQAINNLQVRYWVLTAELKIHYYYLSCYY